MVTIYKVDWYESERGWGQRFDGTQYFETQQEAEDAITRHWENEKKNNPSGATPDYYCFPKGPFEVELSAEALEMAQKKQFLDNLKD